MEHITWRPDDVLVVVRSKTLLAEDTMLLYEYVEDKQLYTTFVDENLDNYYEGLWR